MTLVYHPAASEQNAGHISPAFTLSGFSCLQLQQSWPRLHRRPSQTVLPCPSRHGRRLSLSQLGPQINLTTNIKTMCGSVGFCVRLVTAPVGQDSWLKGGAAGVGVGGSGWSRFEVKKRTSGTLEKGNQGHTCLTD